MIHKKYQALFFLTKKKKTAVYYNCVQNFKN